MSGAAVIRTGEAARRMGIDRSTLVAWAKDDAQLRGCLLRKAWWSVQRLQQRGYLPGVTDTAPALSYTAVLRAM